MYQLQARYVSSTRVPFRFDAGIMPSPVGLFTLELQPNVNPLIGAPSYYFAPLPADRRTVHRRPAHSGGYPIGAMFSVSGSRWDARGGIIDSSPAQPRNVFSGSRPPAEAQLVLGGGVTPIPGMRVGASFTRGRYRPRTTPASIDDPRIATVFNLEGEYAIGHTRLTVSGCGTGSTRHPERPSRAASTCRRRARWRPGSSPPLAPPTSLHRP